jgi:hypothetical protein
LCTSTIQPGDETWTITIDGVAPANQRIAGIAVQSLDRKASGVCPSTNFRTIPSNDGPVATVIAPAPEFASGRLGLDAVLVLDRSGSMFSTDGTATSRLDKLKTATTIPHLWKDLRNSETDLSFSRPPITSASCSSITASVDDGNAANRLVEFNAAAGGPHRGPPSLWAGRLRSAGVEGPTGAMGPETVESQRSGRSRHQQSPAGAPDDRWCAEHEPLRFHLGQRIKTSTDAGNAAGIETLPKQPFQLYTVTVGNGSGPTRRSPEPRDGHRRVP